jgi:pilus assembly protein CpaE
MAFTGDPESERIIRRALPEMAKAPEAVRRGDVAKAVHYLAEHRSPNLLIVDISGEGTPLSKIRQLSDVCEPGVHVIAIGDLDKVALYRDLAQSGIADYVVKPLTVDLIMQAVTIASQPRSGAAVSQKLGKLIAVMGTRGGIGTTSVAVNLAASLANRVGRRVALVDLDLQTGDCSLMLEMKETSALREALEASSRLDKLFLERVMVPHGERLFVLSSAESLCDELRFAPEAIETLVAALQSDFHYVVVDVPRTPSALTQRTIDLAAVRVLVADETIRSAREIVRLREVLGKRPGTGRNLLVINRSGERRSGRIPRNDFLEAIDMEAALSIPFVTASCSGPAANGKTTVGRSGIVSQAVATLAAEISGSPIGPTTWWAPWR